MTKKIGSLQEFEQRYVKPNSGRTLIVGSKIYADKEDRRLRYADAVGVDMLAGEGVDVICDLEDEDSVTAKFMEGLRPESFAHVECMSILEHSAKPWLVAKHLENLMQRGATIFVSVPWLWRTHMYPGDYFRISHMGLEAIFPNIAWQNLGYASDRLRKPLEAIPAIEQDGHPYMARTETVGFGVRK